MVGLWQWRERGRYRCRLEPLVVDIPEDRNEAITALTRQSQRFYESRIRTAPRGWLWLHHRWKLPIDLSIIKVERDQYENEIE